MKMWRFRVPKGHGWVVHSYYVCYEDATDKADSWFGSYQIDEVTVIEVE